MAWRDGRQSLRPLFLSAACMTVGIATLVAINSFKESAAHSLDEHAKVLLGADLVVRSRAPFDSSTEELFRSIGGEQSRQTSFATMAYFPRTRGTRLARVRALTGEFPYYGVFDTDPPSAAQTFKEGPFALVDDALMIQFDARVGDPIQLGDFAFRIAGRLRRVPGEAAIQWFIGPRIYIPMSYIDRTGLLKKGSRVRYGQYFKLREGSETHRLLQRIEPHLNEHGLRSETIDERKAALAEVLRHLSYFLNLVGFLAVVLGAIGVASATHLYIRQKLATIGLLCCLGARRMQLLAVYLLQVAAMGLVAAVLGSGLGLGIQAIFPLIMADFLPVPVLFAVSWNAIAQGAMMGMGAALLAALMPLSVIAAVSPLAVLRRDVEATAPAMKRPSFWIIGGCMILALALFAWSNSLDWQWAIWFTLGVLLCLVLLTGAAHLLMGFTRRTLRRSMKYVLRQGFANLYRPNNQTLVLVLSLGLGAALLLATYLSHQMVLDQISLADYRSQGNLVLFDVQQDQRRQLIDLLGAHGLEVRHEAPIVSMRIVSIEGEKVGDLLKIHSKDRRGWALRRQYRSTYRNHLTDTEKVVAGRWPGRAEAPAAPVPVSLEEEIARTLDVAVGHRIVFDVQGVPIDTAVKSIRRVDWKRVQPNFFVLFPSGVLEEAPQTFVLVTRVESAPESAKLQRAVVAQFPNVSVIDLRLILDTVDGVLEKVSLAVKFIAFFTVLTGLIVLLGAVAATRYQRLQENLLLRTLGASKTQILSITTIEYSLLGMFAGLCALLLATAGGFALANFVFEAAFRPAWISFLALFLLLTAVTVLAGLLGNWGTHNQPPLRLLRSEEQ